MKRNVGREKHWNSNTKKEIRHGWIKVTQKKS